MAKKVVVLALILSSLAMSATASAATTDYRGRFVCDDGRPLAGVRVEVFNVFSRQLPHIWPNARMKVAFRADDNGAWAFRVSGGETNWFIRAVLVGAGGGVKNFPLTWHHYADTLRSQNNRPEHNYGTQTVPGRQCKLWRAFQEAANDFAADTGTPNPAGPITVSSGAPTSGVPFAPYTDVWWPSDYAPYRGNGMTSFSPYAGGKSVAKHEFAHTFRHFLDGNRAHFLGDSAYYWYLRSHSSTSCEPTNIGFAFNEGWAEYWADEVQATPCKNASDFRIERNVAFELKRLQQTCRNASRREMVDVLRRRRVHALSEFATALGCVLPKPIKTTGRAKRPAPTLRKLADSKAAAARPLLASVNSSIRSLRAQTNRATALAKRRPPCPTCAAAVERKINPFLLKAQLQQAQAIKKRYGFLASRKSQRKLAKDTEAQYLRRIATRNAALQRDMKRVTARGLLAGQRSLAKLKGTPAADARKVLSQARGALGKGTQPVLQGMSPLPVAKPKQTGPDPGNAPLVPIDGAPLPVAPVLKPDLVVASIDSMVYTTMPAPACTVRWTLRNQGTSRAGDSTTQLRLTAPDETPLQQAVPSGALEPGQSRQESYVYEGINCDPASLNKPITATVAADSAGVVDELDEQNNALARTFPVP